MQVYSNVGVNAMNSVSDRDGDEICIESSIDDIEAKEQKLIDEEMKRYSIRPLTDEGI
jgi:hypothetical protein